MRRAIFGVTVCVLAVLAYCAWPLVGAAQLAAAAEQGNAAAAMDRVDLPSLRKSLAHQIVRAYLKQNGRYQKLSVTERGLAGSVGMTVADSLLRDVLTPENITSLLDKGRVAQGSAGDLMRLPHFSEVFRSIPLRVITNSYFDGLTSFVVVSDEAGEYGVHLRLSGTVWKLSGLDIPESLSDRLAREVLRREKPAD